MRALLAIFLCLSIAFQGMAFAHALTQPCAMEQGKSSVTMKYSDTASDCCNDADTVARTGKPCKTVQTCSPADAFVDSSFKADTLPPVGSVLVMAGTFFMPLADLSNIWRPPTSG